MIFKYDFYSFDQMKNVLLEIFKKLNKNILCKYIMFRM